MTVGAATHKFASGVVAHVVQQIRPAGAQRRLAQQQPASMSRVQFTVRFVAMVAACSASIMAIFAVRCATARPVWFVLVELFGMFAVAAMPSTRGITVDGPALQACTTVGVACSFYVFADAMPSLFVKSASGVTACIMRVVANHLICTAVVEPLGGPLLPSRGGGVRPVALWGFTAATLASIVILGAGELPCVADTVVRCITAGVWWRWRRSSGREMVAFIFCTCCMAAVAGARMLDLLVALGAEDVTCPPYGALLQQSGVCGVAFIAAVLADGTVSHGTPLATGP